MAGRSFHGGNPRRFLSKNTVHTGDLRRIETRRPSGMKRNPIHRRGLIFCIQKKSLKHARPGVRSHEMPSLVGTSSTKPLGQGQRATPRGMGGGLQNHTGGTFRREHTRATSTQGPAIRIPRHTAATAHGGSQRGRHLGIRRHGHHGIQHSRGDQRSRQIKDLCSGGGGCVKREIRTTEPVSNRRSGCDGISPPSTDRIRRKFFGSGCVLLHCHQAPERTSADAPDRRQAVFRSLPAQAVAFGGKSRRTPSALHHGQGEKLVTGQNRSIPRVQSRHLPQRFRVGKHTANGLVIAKAFKEPFHGIHPSGQNAATGQENRGRLGMKQHASLINGPALQLNAKVSLVF